MRAIIIGGGVPPKKELLEEYMDKNYIIIAADGGADVLSQYKILPDYLLGDFDSISKNVYEHFSKDINIMRFPREKDYTDAQAAFNKAVELGAEEIIMLGCTGKRIDHFMANLCILYEGLQKKIKTYIVDDYNEIFMINKSTVLKGKKDMVFSLFSYSEDTKDLTIRGAKYPLINYYLSQTDNLTVSNEFLKEAVEIEFSKGCLLIMKNKK